MVPGIEKSPEILREIPLTAEQISERLAKLKEKKNTKEAATPEYKKDVRQMDVQISKLEKTSSVSPEKILTLRNELESLSEELGDPDQTAGQKDATTDDKAAKTFLGMDQKTLTQAATALGVVAAGTAIVLAWRGLMKLLGEGKKVVGEKVKQGWGWLKWVGLATAGGLLTFFGLKVMQDRLLKPLEDAKAELKEAGKKAVDTVVETGKDAANKVKTGTAAAVATGASKVETLKKKAKPGAEKIAEQAKGMAKEEVIARIVIAQHAPNWALDDTAKKNQLIGLLSINANKKMKDIDHARDSGSQELALDISENTEDRANREQSVSALLDYCDDYRPRVIDGIKNEKKCDTAEAERLIGEMTLSTYLDYALRNTDSFIRAASELEKGAGSFDKLMETLKNLNFTYILKGDQYMEAEVQKICEEGKKDFNLSDEEINDINFIDLLQSSLTTSQGTLLDEHKRLQASAVTPSDKILKFIYGKILENSNDTHKVMLPLFHGVFPTNEPGKTPEETVRIYLTERMTPAEALRFYMYHRILTQGNAAVLPIMQMEVIRFIARHETGLLAGTGKYTALFRMGTSLAYNGGADLIDEWKKLNLDLTIDLTEDEKSMITYLGRTLLWAPAAATVEHGKGVVGLVRANPGIAALAFSGLAAGEVALIRGKPLITGGNLQEFKKMVDALPDVSGKKALVPWVSGGLRRALSAIVATHPELTEAKSAWTTIFAKGLHEYHDQKVVEKATGLFRDCINRPRSIKNWTNLATELKAVAAATGSPELLHAAKRAEEMSLPAKARIRRIYGSMAVGFRTTVKSTILTAGVQPAYSATKVLIDRTAATAIDATKDLYVAIRNSAWLKMALAKAGTNVDVFIRALASAKIPPQVIALIAKSKGAMLMFANAFQKGGTAAIHYLGKLSAVLPYAKMARFPVGLIGLEGLFYYIEMTTINAELNETSSPQLKELLEARKAVAAGRVAVTTTGSVVGRYGGKLGGKLASRVFLPVWITYEVADATRRYFEESTKEWAKDDKDMLRDSPGTLVGKLKDTAPGEHKYRDQNAARGDSILSGSLLAQGLTFGSGGEERFNKVEKTQIGQRGKITQAFLYHMTDLPKSEDETDAEYRERFARFQTVQNNHINTMSDGTYSLQYTNVYRSAHLDAEVKLLSEELQQSGESQFIPLIKQGGDGKFTANGEFDLADYVKLPPFGQQNAEGISRLQVINSYRAQQKGLALMTGDILKAMYGSQGESRNILHKQDMAIQRVLLQDTRHDLAFLEQRLLAADLKGWDATGYEEATRGLIRNAVSVEFRKLLRMESDRLTAKAESGLEDMEASIQRLRTFLQQDVKVFEDLADTGGYTQGAKEFVAANQGSSALLTDWRWIQGNLYLHPPAPESAPQRTNGQMANNDAVNTGDIAPPPVLAA